MQITKWDFTVLGTGLGLFLGRTAAEAQPNPWPLPLTLALTLAAVLLGIGLAYWARPRLNLAPLAVLWLYVLWPRIDPSIAVVVGALATLSLAILHSRVLSAAWIDAAIFVLFFGLYVSTLAPTVLPADSGEFQLVSSVLGIAHPPGYPLYTILGKLFTFLPIGDLAHRVNLLSSVIAALTLVVVSRTLRLVTRSSWGGFLAALVLGVSTTFWAQATTANIRTLTAFFAALILYSTVAYGHEKKLSHLMLLAAALGMGITHHLSLILFIPPVAAYLILTDPRLVGRGQWLARAAIAFLASLVFLLYIPIRAWTGAPFGAEGLNRMQGVLRHILGLGFQGDLFFFARPEFLPERFQIWLNILDFQFGPAILLLMLAGSLLLALQNWRFFLLWGGAFVFVGFTGITYRAPQTVEYLLPSYIPLVLALGYGGGVLADVIKRYSVPRALFLSSVVLLGGQQFLAHYPSYRELSQDRSAREYAETIFRQAPQGATVLTSWHWATPLWYMQYVEGKRPDLSVQYVFPQGAQPIADTWQERLVESVEQGPTVVTNYYPGFLYIPYRFYPLGDAFLVRKEPSFTPSTEFTLLNADFGERIRILGYRLRDIEPGKPLVLDLFWQPLVPLDRDYSFFVHLAAPDGSVVGQMDITHAATRYEPGEILVDRYRITSLPTVSTGNYRLITGVYFTLSEGGWQRLTTESGQEMVVLQTINWRTGGQEPLSLHPLYQPFDGGLVLTGVDYDTTLPGTRRIYLHWQGLSAQANASAYRLTRQGQVVAEGKVPGFTGSHITAVDTPANAWPLVLEVFPLDRPVEAIPALGLWNLALAGSVSLPGPGNSRYVDLGGEVLLVAVRLPERPLVPGEEFAVELKLAALGPLISDYSFSVRLVDSQDQWESPPVDTSPALGAIPTLKWIRGSVIYDRHILRVPENASPGVANISLVVYDSFTLRPLAILDERIARLGANVPLGQVQIAAP